MQKKLYLIHKDYISKSSSVEYLKNSDCYYLSNDFASFLMIKNHLSGIEVANLAGEFRKAVHMLWEPFLQLFVVLNKKYDSVSWWGSTIASRNAASTPLFLNVVYLYCADIMLSRADGDIAFISDSHTLMDCIANIASKRGFDVQFSHAKAQKTIEKIKIIPKMIAKAVIYLWKTIERVVVTFLKLKKEKLPQDDNKPIAVIRSWVNQSNFQKDGSFKDRNFGELSKLLESKGYMVMVQPMFFDLKISFSSMLEKMSESGTHFLLPYRYLKVGDYIQILLNELKCLKISFRGLKLGIIDISKIFTDIQMKQMFSPDLLGLNMTYFLLKRLKEEGLNISRFYYPFENNPPEKLFIKGIRTFHPESEIIAYQHTVWYTEQCGMYLGHKESELHPLADRIVTSGPIYLNVLKEAGFPEEILISGPNLRFSGLSGHRKTAHYGNKSVKNIMLPLCFERNLSYELIYKVKSAFDNNPGYRIYIRPHPLIPVDELQSILDLIGMTNYEVSNEGTMQDWLQKANAVISTGCTVSILEAVIMGIPTIRVAPDNYFFLDPMVWSDYPLKPVSQSEEIISQLAEIEQMLQEGHEVFEKVAVNTMNDYFSDADEKNMMSLL